MNNKLIGKKIIILLLIIVSMFFLLFNKAIIFLENKPVLNNTQIEETSENDILGTYPNVGIGKEKWEDHYFAPFVDLAGWSQYDGTVSGVSPFSTWGSITGTNYYNLGFIDCISHNEEDYSSNYDNGIIPWGWGGWPSYSRYVIPDPHEEEIENQIGKIRSNGGDVMASFGGANLTPFWISPSVTEDSLVETYEEIIKGYSLTHIDFDIEGRGPAESLAPNQLNAAALKRVQADTGVTIDLTLPVTISGLDSMGLDVLNAYLQAGVDINVINVMAMLFGGDEGHSAISATEGLQKQIIQAYSDVDITLTDEEAYSKIGITNSIDKEGAYTFSLEDAKVVKDYSVDKNIGMLSAWNANRDAHDNATYTTTKDVWAYTDIFRDFSDHDDTGGGDRTPPTVPTNLSNGGVTDFSIDLNWSPSEDESEGSGLSHYSVHSEKDDGTSKQDKVTTGTETSITLDGLDRDTNYNLKVKAIDNAGNESQFSSPLKIKTDPKTDTTPPSIPNGLVESGKSKDSVSLGWNESTDTESGIDHYVVHIQNDDSSYSKDESTSEKSITFSSLAADTDYHLTVKAVNGASLESQPSSEIIIHTDAGTDTTPPSIPDGLVESGKSKDSVSLSWNESTDAESGIDHYVVHIQNGDYSYSDDKSTSEKNITFDSLDVDTDYHLTVKAVNGASLESQPSSEIIIHTDAGTDIIPPSKPIGLSKKGEPTESSITLTWEASTDEEGGSGMSYYKVEIKDDFGYDETKQTSDKSTLEMTFDNLTSLTKYHFTVVAFDVSGNNSETSETLDISTAKEGENNPPSKVTNLISKNVKNNSLTIVWSNAVDEDIGDRIDHYLISLDQDTYIEVQPSDDLQYTFNKLDAGKEYNIDVLAVDSHEAKGSADSISVMTTNVSDGGKKTKAIAIATISSIMVVGVIALIIII